MARTNFLVLTGVLTLMSLQGCMGQISIETEPENVAGILGSTEEVLLPCKLSMDADESVPQLYSWSMADGQKIYTNEVKQDHELKDNFDLASVITEKQWTNYDLKVRTTVAGVAARYVCLGVEGVTVSKAADVLLVESHPTCSQDKEEYIDGETATVSCEVRYHGRWGPDMTLTGSGQLEDNSGGNLVKWSIKLEVNPGNDGEMFICKTEYGAPPSPDPDEDAANKPDFTLNDCTKTIVVHYSARNTTIQQDSASVGDTLTCVSIANPPVEESGFEWNVGGETSEGSTFILEEKHQGELNITCCATNTIGGPNCDEKISMPIVTTTSTTTTTTTTTTAAPDPTSGQSSPDPGESTGGDDSLAAGAIAGIVVGCLILVLVLLLLFYYFCIHRNKKQDEANSTAPSSKANKPVHADQVRQPPQPNPYAVEDDTKPAYLYDDPNKNVSDGVVYADLALDNTPRSRNPIQVYEPTQYAEIRHPPPHV